MPKYNPTTSGNPYVTAFHDLMATSKDFAKFLSDPAERQNIHQGFTDAVNRGAVAATLGFPVDMANAALNLGKATVGYLGNKAGVLSADQMPQLIDNPVGGSEYIGNQMRRLGVVSPNRNALAEGLAGFLPMSPSTSGKAVAAIGAGGMVPGMDLAATVFHGSPHKFDRFDSSKIGTGEGAQAYGHGLYLADSPAVAGSYKTGGGGFQAAMPSDNVMIDGKTWAKTLPRSSVESQAATVFKNDLFGSTIPEKVAKLRAAKMEPVADWLEKNAGRLSLDQGSLYKVDLPDEAIAKMLDWDKPLSQQPDVVKTLQQEYAPSYISQFMDRPGSDLYKAISGGSGVEDLRASGAAELAKQGIPGIRYLDAGSRGQGQGTSNYVVFPGEENMLRILERNGRVLK